MGGILSTKEHLSVEQMQEAKDMWEREYSGIANAHKMAILGGGFQYQPLTVPLEQLQFLEMRKYTTEEIARVYGVPPAMIGLEGNTAYSNGASAHNNVYGIIAECGCTVIGNTAYDNGDSAEGDVWGFWFIQYNLVDQNTAYSNGTGAGSATNMRTGATGCVYGNNVY